MGSEYSPLFGPAFTPSTKVHLKLYQLTSLCCLFLSFCVHACPHEPVCICMCFVSLPQWEQFFQQEHSGWLKWLFFLFFAKALSVKCELLEEGWDKTFATAVFVFLKPLCLSVYISLRSSIKSTLFWKTKTMSIFHCVIFTVCEIYKTAVWKKYINAQMYSTKETTLVCKGFYSVFQYSLVSLNGWEITAIKHVLHDIKVSKRKVQLQLE